MDGMIPWLSWGLWVWGDWIAWFYILYLGERDVSSWHPTEENENAIQRSPWANRGV